MSEKEPLDSKLKTENPPKQIFEDFPAVDCNDCEKYWLNQCDGVNNAQKRTCKEFLAVRRVNIPLQIKNLQESLIRLSNRLFLDEVIIFVLAFAIVCFIAW
jgi:hypothetical protein